MGWLGDYKPALAMIGLQFAYAGVSLTGRAALLQGMSPMVYVVYRQAIATLVMAPMAYFTRTKTSRCSMGWRSFYLIFLASLFGVTICQATFFEGIFLASSSIGSALFNLTPTVTLVMASIVGLEKLSLRSLKSIAKIMGTVICAGGAVAIALLRGPKLFNTDFLPRKLVLGSETESWLLGCLLCFGSSCCWSLWLILQVPVCASYPDRLSLSTWMCFMSTLQSAAITLVLEHDLGAWKLHSNLELACCIYSGVIGSGLSFVVLAWCISRKGPLFSAMFNPVCTVIVTIFGSIFLREKVYAGSLLGAAGVIIGLYIVLWGKATDNEELDAEINPIPQVLMDESSKRTSCTINLEEPLLSKKSTDVMSV